MNGAAMRSSHFAELIIPGLPPSARIVHVVPALTTKSLLSIGQLCDAGCSATFDATTATITYDNEIVLVGTRTDATKLWHLELPSTEHSANAAIGTATPAELEAFGHAALFSPALSTLEKALNNGFITNFPGLTPATLKKHPPHSIAMVKGHLDQTRKNVRSTKPAQQGSNQTDSPTLNNAELVLDDTTDDPFPPGLNNTTNDDNHCCYADICQPTGQIYSNLTGKFIEPSSNGNNYILIIYDYDSNSILAEPMKTRTAKSILDA
jgi:hypothetical protein